MKNKITFLGPLGATFSHHAYEILAEKYGAPKISETNCEVTSSNNEILETVLTHGGYGAVAMETLSDGRVTEPIESFVGLLKKFSDPKSCPVHVVGAVRLKIHFCLMIHPDVELSDISSVIAHPKSLVACRQGILDRNLISTNTGKSESSLSNGEAARLVSEDDDYKYTAAIGPKSAAKKYGLKIIDSAFEDKEAFTTFFLIAPKSHSVSVGKENRALIVFKASHTPGSLVGSLLPFADKGLNLIQIHSVHAEERNYNFAIEVDVSESEIKFFEQAMKRFQKCVDSYICFGPFEVFSK